MRLGHIHNPNRKKEKKVPCENILQGCFSPFPRVVVSPLLLLLCCLSIPSAPATSGHYAQESNNITTESPSEIIIIIIIISSSCRERKNSFFFLLSKKEKTKPMTWISISNVLDAARLNSLGPATSLTGRLRSPRLGVSYLLCLTRSTSRKATFCLWSYSSFPLFLWYTPWWILDVGVWWCIAGHPRVQ